MKERYKQKSKIQMRIPEEVEDPFREELDRYESNYNDLLDDNKMLLKKIQNLHSDKAKMVQQLANGGGGEGNAERVNELKEKLKKLGKDSEQEISDLRAKLR